MAGLEPIDLVERNHDRDAESEDPGGDEAIARADPLSRAALKAWLAAHGGPTCTGG